VRAATLLRSVGVPLHTMATNFQELGLEWTQVFAAAIVSGLMFLQETYGTGLLASAVPYDRLIVPLGADPITAPLMSRDPLRVVHDGADASRVEKARAIAEWPEALELLRVCWEGAQKDRNCGECEKCVRTVLDFRLAGVLPAAFPRDVT